MSARNFFLLPFWTWDVSLSESQSFWPRRQILRFKLQEFLQICAGVSCYSYHIFTLVTIITTNQIWDKKLFICCRYCGASGCWLEKGRDECDKRGGGWTEVKYCRGNTVVEWNVRCWTSQRGSVIWCNTSASLNSSSYFIFTAFFTLFDQVTLEVCEASADTNIQSCYPYEGAATSGGNLKRGLTIDSKINTG